jgi:membrane-bound lytic murein transglycosylase D
LRANRNLIVAMGVGMALFSAATLAQGHSSGGALPPHLASLQDGFRYGFPPYIDKRGLTFAGESVPLARGDVRMRILKEINYFLQDKRALLLLWLSRADSLRHVVSPILRQYGLPEEFVYLAAIESSYNSRSLSSAGAYGYWQFIKATALKGPGGADKYDWRMNITKWKDERADLVHSTHSAAKYLAWMNQIKKVSLEGKPDGEGFKNWFLSAAAYNAGPSRVVERLTAFGAKSYWDVALPVETEKYVPRWIALALISKHRNFYGVQVTRQNPLSFDTVENLRLKKDLSFAEMARLLGTTPRSVWSLNTQIPPEKGVFPARHGGKQIEHKINVPHGTRSKFIAELAAHGYTGKATPRVSQERGSKRQALR